MLRPLKNDDDDDDLGNTTDGTREQEGDQVFSWSALQEPLAPQRHQQRWCQGERRLLQVQAAYELYPRTSHEQSTLVSSLTHHSQFYGRKGDAPYHCWGIPSCLARVSLPAWYLNHSLYSRRAARTFGSFFGIVLACLSKHCRVRNPHGREIGFWLYIASETYRAIDLPYTLSEASVDFRLHRPLPAPVYVHLFVRKFWQNTRGFVHSQPPYLGRGYTCRGYRTAQDYCRIRPTFSPPKLGSNKTFCDLPPETLVFPCGLNALWTHLDEYALQRLDTIQDSQHHPPHAATTTLFDQQHSSSLLTILQRHYRQNASPTVVPTAPSDAASFLKTLFKKSTSHASSRRDAAFYSYLQDIQSQYSPERLDFVIDHCHDIHNNNTSESDAILRFRSLLQAAAQHASSTLARQISASLSVPSTHVSGHVDAEGRPRNGDDLHSKPVFSSDPSGSSVSSGCQTIPIQSNATLLLSEYQRTVVYPYEIQRAEQYLHRNPHVLTWLDLDNLRWFTWRRTAVQSSFRKLVGRIDEDLTPGEYRLTFSVNDAFPVVKGVTLMANVPHTGTHQTFVSILCGVTALLQFSLWLI